MGELANEEMLISTKMQVPYMEVLYGLIAMICGLAYDCAGDSTRWLKPQNKRLQRDASGSKPYTDPALFPGMYAEPPTQSSYLASATTATTQLIGALLTESLQNASYGTLHLPR